MTNKQELIEKLKQGIYFKAAKELQKICKPLFENFNLNYFNYVRVYPDNTYITLMTDPDWFLHYFEKEYNLVGAESSTTGFYLWKDYMPKNALKDAAELFNHHDGIAILNDHKLFLEVVEFAAASKDKEIYDFYLNNLEILNNFVFYFKEQAAHLIQEALTERFSIPQKMDGEQLQKEPYDDLIAKIKAKKIHLTLKDREVHVSAREYECLLLLAEGKAIKEIASDLNISPRTVEEHIINAKNKTDCSTRKQLIKLVKANKIHKK